MHKEAIEALKKLDYSSSKSVIETDREVNRFGLYIVRLLKMAVSNQRIVKEIGLSSQKDCLGYRLIAKSVEKLQEENKLKLDRMEKLIERKLATEVTVARKKEMIVNVDYALQKISKKFEENPDLVSNFHRNFEEILNQVKT